MRQQRELWECPRCGRRFANRNQSHSCGEYSLEDFLRDKPASALQLFERFSELVRECGPVEYAPAKTRVGFQVRMIFAAVNKLSPKGLEAHVVLARRLESPRFHEIESVGPRSHVHHFRIGSLAELDDEVRGWLAEAYAVGEQKHLG